MNDDLEDRLDAVEQQVDGNDAGPTIAYEDAEGTLLGMDGDPVPPEVSPVFVLPFEVVSTWPTFDAAATDGGDR